MNRSLLALLCAFSAVPAAMAADAAKQLTIHIRDYAAMPVTGKPDGKLQGDANLARINFMREEPGPARNRFFVNDQNGFLYIVDRKTKQVTPYLNFNGRDGRKGMFRRFTFNVGFASGLICFQFDPDYRRNGRFYTLHMEETSVEELREPDSSSVPGLTTKDYEPTEPIHTPGPVSREVVMIEWTDTNTANASFEGAAREVMRLQYNGQIHPMGDMIFNPIARPGSPEWRVMYVACGDGGSGESRNLAMRYNPQRLDTMVGKILRIIPDPGEHPGTSRVSDNSRYRVPNDNPFAGRAGARPEIWAYGIRNPHRLTWDVDPRDRKKNHLFASVVGLSTWETVLLIRKGVNYGYSEREGNQQMLPPNNRMGPLPEDDRIPVRIGEQATAELVRPVYPIAQYEHAASGGDAIAGGFVYRGKLAALRGKFIWGDITTGHIWWTDVNDLIGADDGDPKTMAPLHEVRIQWDGPEGNGELYNSMASIAAIGYRRRGGLNNPLPGSARVAKTRADVRFAVDNSGEFYLLTKSDGIIREVTGAVEQTVEQ